MFKHIVVSAALVVVACGISAQSATEKQRAIDKIVAAEQAPRISEAHKLTEANILAVIKAVEDEIYDYGYCKEYYGLGPNMGDYTPWISKLPVYITPSTDKDGSGVAIYRLMPYGEVYRYFFIRKDGIAVLVGNPENGFPITQPSHLTLFDDDDDTCSKKHRWVRSVFTILVKPPLDVVESAAARQETRVGFSDWKYKTTKEKPQPPPNASPDTVPK